MVARVEGLAGTGQRDAVESIVNACAEAYRLDISLAELQLELATIEQAMASRASLPVEVAKKRDMELELLFKWIETVYITMRLVEAMAEAKRAQEDGDAGADGEAPPDPVEAALEVGSPDLTRFVHGVVQMSRAQEYDARRQLLEQQFAGSVPPGSAMGTMQASMRLVLLVLVQHEIEQESASGGGAEAS